MQYAAVRKKDRVVIANSARAMRDMLFDAIRKELHFTVVAEVADGVSIATVCELEQADYVLIPLEDGRAPIQLCKEILRKRPEMKVIAVEAAAEITALCWWSDGEVRCSYMKSSRDNLVRALGCTIP